MLLAIIRYMMGYLRIRITGYSPERFLNMCRHRNIYLWDLTPCEGSYEMYIQIQGFRQLKPIIRKTRMKVSICQRIGLPFLLFRYRRRKVFWIGMIACVVAIYIGSRFIWAIEIEGNLRRTDEVLLEYLDSMEVFHGMKKSDLDCAQIAKNLRKQFDDIIWVSASVDGTKLLLQIKENADSLMVDTQSEETPSNLVAAKAGKITQIITRNGVPMVTVGDVVEQGTVLVSGCVEVVDDSGEVVNYHYQYADADILAQTEHSYCEQLMLTHQVKQYTNKKRACYLFTIGNTHLQLGFGTDAFDTKEIHSHQQQLCLEEQFYLPISVGKRTYLEYELQEAVYSKAEAQKILSASFATYCKQLEDAGIEIVKKEVHIRFTTSSAIAEGTLTVIEPIGTHIKIDF